ncbi:hypothetical protein B0H19DRAFT_1083014 [Mycena capillaripes]|nr:hypothetical protein B0H19DRAFT_1083014 [Mycena capillaripes]
MPNFSPDSPSDNGARGRPRMEKVTDVLSLLGLGVEHRTATAAREHRTPTHRPTAQTVCACPEFEARRQQDVHRLTCILRTRITRHARVDERRAVDIYPRRRCAYTSPAQDCILSAGVAHRYPAPVRTDTAHNLLYIRTSFRIAYRIDPTRKTERKRKGAEKEREITHVLVLDLPAVAVSRRFVRVPAQSA